MLGTQDLMIALVIGLFFFGAKKLPELAGSLGKSMKEFKKATTGADEPETSAASPAPPPPAPTVTTAQASRHCVKCEAALQPDWTHCPRCGEAARVL